MLSLALRLRILHPVPAFVGSCSAIFSIPRDSRLIHSSTERGGQQGMPDRKQLWRRPLLKSGSPYDDQGLANNQIRLLTIRTVLKESKLSSRWESVKAKMKEPGRDFTWIRPEISIELQTHRHELTEDLEFDAISYVWGTAPASVTVICNKRPLLITPTARQMLLHLHDYQGKTQRRKVWIDAICINQDDE